MKKIAIYIALLFTYLFISHQVALAEYVLAPTEKPSKQILVNKQVKNPKTGQFVENLNTSDPSYLPTQEVIFKIEVKNIGQTELTNIQIKDKLPDFVNFISGPGSFDMNSKTVNLTVDKLNPQESKTFELKIKVKPQKELPANRLTCLTNFAEARVDQLFSQDTAAFCIETQVLAPIQELPKTGPKETTLLLISSSIFLALSMALFLKTKAID